MEDLRHTKNVLKNENYFQCFHNNVGYCKYRDHCQYQHFTEICQKTVCRDKTCKFRHPRSCKFGEHCRFLRKKCCLYRHKILRSNVDEESENFSFYYCKSLSFSNFSHQLQKNDLFFSVGACLYVCQKKRAEMNQDEAGISAIHVACV